MKKLLTGSLAVAGVWLIVPVSADLIYSSISGNQAFAQSGKCVRFCGGGTSRGTSPSRRARPRGRQDYKNAGRKIAAREYHKKGTYYFHLSPLTSANKLKALKYYRHANVAWPHPTTRLMIRRTLRSYWNLRGLESYKIGKCRDAAKFFQNAFKFVGSTSPKYLQATRRSLIANFASARRCMKRQAGAQQQRARAARNAKRREYWRRVRTAEQ